MVYEPTHLVYLGSDAATVALLRAVVLGNGRLRSAASKPGDARPTSDGADVEQAGPTYFEVVTSQKAALLFLKEHPTATFVVETGAKPEGRVNFCKTLRARIPTAAIVAVGSGTRSYGFPFDAVLALPLEKDEVHRALTGLRGDPLGPMRTLGPIRLDIIARKVVSGRGEFEMTPKQCALLQLLMENAGAVVRRADIMRTVWETSYLADTRTLDVHIRWLRRKIEPDPAAPTFLITVRGEGYKFVVPEEASDQ